MNPDELHRLLRTVGEQQSLRDVYNSIKPHIEASNWIKRSLGVDLRTLANVTSEAERIHRAVALSSAERLTLEEYAKLTGKRQLMRLADQVADARSLGILNPGDDIKLSVQAALDANAAYGDRFRLPEQSELEALAKQALHQLALPAAIVVASDSLEAAMGKMHFAWLQKTHSEDSARAFAGLIGIGRGLDRLPPFDDALSQALRCSLGDWRQETAGSLDHLIDPVARIEFYRGRGFDSALTDFTVAAFHEGLQLAGLSEDSSDAVPAAADQEDDEAVEAREAYGRLRELESALRRLIEQRMQAAFGEQWKRTQLPSDVLLGWVEKKEKATAAGVAPADTPLIAFADFSEYIQIIERRDNWQHAFKAVFVRKEDVTESFRRMGPLRIAVMHSRPLIPDDLLLLAVESKRVLKAIKAAES